MKRRAESRETSVGVLARNNVSCKRLMRDSLVAGLFFDMIDITDLIDMIWRASVPTSRLPLCGRMVSGFIAERRDGQASACPAAHVPPT